MTITAEIHTRMLLTMKKGESPAVRSRVRCTIVTVGRSSVGDMCVLELAWTTKVYITLKLVSVAEGESN